MRYTIKIRLAICADVSAIASPILPMASWVLLLLVVVTFFESMPFLTVQLVASKVAPSMVTAPVVLYRDRFSTSRLGPSVQTRILGHLGSQFGSALRFIANSSARVINSSVM
jgi:hypothetical protein